MDAEVPVTAKKKNAKRAPREKFFRWLNYEFRWLSHTEAEDDDELPKRKRKREMKSYRVTNANTNEFMGWFDDVDVAKTYLLGRALDHVITNIRPLEEYLCAIEKQMNALKKDLDHLRWMLDPKCRRIP